MAPRFHNTLTRGKEPFEPLAPPKVTLYTCGPTVHDYAHLGNFRTYVFEDLLRRYLVFRGYKVVQAMNITDVEDKIIKRAGEAGIPISDYTESYTEAFFEDLETLHIEKAEHYPRATEYIPQMIELVSRIKEKGATYESGGSIYFKIASFPDYGKLSGIDPGSVLSGARVDVDEYGKDDARDFVLWKAAKPGEPSWDSSFGPGRPGWHIECSAMSTSLLGASIDIHTGGMDNIFPHHENEIAQSETAFGKRFVGTWLHSAWLTLEGDKMSKSLGNFVTVRDLVKEGVSPMAIRFLLMRHHYRKPLLFGQDELETAAAALSRLKTLWDRLRNDQAAGDDDMEQEIRQAAVAFIEAMDDDLNISEGLGAVFTLARKVHAALDAGRLSPKGLDAAEALFSDWDRVLGLLGGPEAKLPAEIEDLVRRRLQARKDRDFAASDRLRDLLQSKGVAVEDLPSGSRVKYQGASVMVSP